MGFCWGVFPLTCLKTYFCLKSRSDFLGSFCCTPEWVNRRQHAYLIMETKTSFFNNKKPPTSSYFIPPQLPKHEYVPFRIPAVFFTGPATKAHLFWWVSFAMNDDDLFDLDEGVPQTRGQKGWLIFTGWNAILLKERCVLLFLLKRICGNLVYVRKIYRMGYRSFLSGNACMKQACISWDRMYAKMARNLKGWNTTICLGI